MNSSLKIFLVLLSVLFGTKAYSQIVFGPDPYLQKSRIGLVDEFMKRFNGETLHPNISKKAKDRHKKNLQLLFNLAQYKSKQDPSFIKATDMVETIIKDSVTIHFNDKKWAAIAHCSGTIDGKKTTFTVYLTVQQRKADMYKWVISKVEGKCFEISPRDTSDKIMLYPDDHETNFISLSRMTQEQPYNIKVFMSKEHEYDETSVFMYLVRTKRLKINYVENLEFMFMQIPGYAFHIQYYERESGNSGWLISKFYHYTDAEKNNLLGSLHIQNPNKHLGYTHTYNNTILEKLDTTADISKRRLNEQILLMNDYLSYIKDKSRPKEQRLYYQVKCHELFAPNTIVTIKDSIESKTLSLNEFTSNLLHNKYNELGIDSLCVPACTTGNLNIDDGLVQIDLPSVIVDLKGLPLSEPVMETNNTLFVRKVITEDGLEWIPVLGNLYVTLKKQ